MRLLNLRVTHREGGLSLLETARIRDAGAFQADAVGELVAKGTVVIQTCHRTEVFADVGEGRSEAPMRLTDLWQRHASGTGFRSHIVCSVDGGAVHHLLRLICGLDSVVLGELEVAEQVRDAYNLSRDRGATTPLLSQVFESSLRTAGRIRATLGLDDDAHNLGELAVEFASQLLGRVSGALVIGTGRAGRMLVKALKRRGVERIYLAGRSLERCRQVAAEFGVQPLALGSELEQVDGLDAIFVATSPGLGSIPVERLGRGGRDGRLLILDLSVPRCIEPGLKGVDGLLLATLDDLGQLARQAREGLGDRVMEAEVLVAQEAERIWGQVLASRAKPPIDSMFRRAEWIRRRELGRAMEELGPQTPETLLVLERMTRSIVEGILVDVAREIRDRVVLGEAWGGGEG